MNLVIKQFDELGFIVIISEMSYYNRKALISKARGYYDQPQGNSVPKSANGAVTKVKGKPAMKGVHVDPKTNLTGKRPISVRVIILAFARS